MLLVVIVYVYNKDIIMVPMVFFFQAEDGIRDLVRSRGLGDVYKRQKQNDVTIARTIIVDLFIFVYLFSF